MIFVIVATAAREPCTATSSGKCNNSILSIQGNILLGPQILDSMQLRFLNTTGDLACKLMAALQGAKVVGADTRCTQYSISSYSAFIRVANSSDVAGSLHLDISVNTYPGNNDPIDSLQILFQQWGGCAPVYVQPVLSGKGIFIYPTIANEKFFINTKNSATYTIHDLLGREVLHGKVSSLETIDVSNWTKGIYFVTVKTENEKSVVKLIVE